MGTRESRILITQRRVNKLIKYIEALCKILKDSRVVKVKILALIVMQSVNFHTSCIRYRGEAKN